MPTKKRHFGNIRTLPSGRVQARFTAPDGGVVTAPQTFRSVKDADRWLALQYADLTHGTWRDLNAGNLTLAEYAQSWLALRITLSPRTADLYGRILQRFVIDAAPSASSGTCGPDYRLGDRPLRQITPTVVTRWFTWVCDVSKEGATRRAQATAGQGPRWNQAVRGWAREQGITVAGAGRLPAEVTDGWVSAGRPALLSTANVSDNPGRPQAAQAYRLLHAIFESAVKDGLIQVNPCQINGVSQTRAPERVPASTSELRAITEAMPERYRAAVLIAAWGGLRAGEIFALARRHVDIESGAVTVERALNYLPGTGFCFGPPKSRAGYRTVHLPHDVMEAVDTHMVAYTGVGGDSLVFTTTNGTPVHSGTRTTMFRRAAAAAGRDDLRFHDLRHTGATLAAQSGATLPGLMRRLGHSSVRAALIYQHATDDADQRLAQRLGELRRAV